jgi:hypothetical protein
MPLPRVSVLLSGLTSGALAGAAGATALNAYTYASQAVTGSPSSATPDQAAQATVEAVGATVPGSPDTRQNRLEGLGPLTGYGVGLGVGAIAGVLRAAGVKVPIGLAPVAVGLAAMAISDSTMTALKITDPRSWTPSSVVNDAVPHLFYGAVTVLALHRMVDSHTVQVR